MDGRSAGPIIVERVTDMISVCADLDDETAALRTVIDAGGAGALERPTPAEGWSVRDQITHLAYFDRAAVTAVTEPERFAAESAAMMSDASGGEDGILALGRQRDVLAWWRDERAAMTEVFRRLDPRQRIPWYGPPMSALSFATARLMETWAHGQDVVDALGARRPATDRLRHVAHIGVRARPFSYATRGLTAPDAEVYVALTAPSGETWEWGSPAENRVTGPALDFCLVVTQRRHVADSSLVIEGPEATEWMSVAQAFAGPPGPGRQPGQFPS